LYRITGLIVTAFGSRLVFPAYKNLQSNVWFNTKFSCRTNCKYKWTNTFFEKENLPIFKIQTVHKADKSTWNQWAINNDVGRLIKGTKEVEYSPLVYKSANKTFITKTRLSAFLRTDLENQLRKLNCTELVIFGYSIDNCVGQTSIDGYEYDFKITLADDAILGTNEKNGNLMLESLKKDLK